MNPRLRLGPPALALALVAAVPAAAPAATRPTDIVEGTWDFANFTVSCTTGLNSWTCTYKYRSYNCQEGSVGGTNVTLPCAATFEVTLDIQPRLNESGNRVGCISVPLTIRRPLFGYDSFVDEYDYTASAMTFAAVNDGHLKMAFDRGNQQWHWRSATVALATTCASGAQVSGLANSPGSVSVTTDF